jgi:hypothetical protein
MPRVGATGGPETILSPVAQSLAAPGAPGASPLRAKARTGEAPNAKASVAHNTQARLDKGVIRPTL